jgi:hypothetical protein
VSVRKAAWVVVALAVVVGLPLAGHWARRPADPGCALDGAPVDPAYRVEVVDEQGQTHAFCCLTCARIWLHRHGTPPRAVTVTDESTGRPLDAADAHYVRSAVVTTPATGNRIHVFASRADAQRHADSFGGTVLEGSDRPLP